jgi:hypothetical protein
LLLNQLLLLHYLHHQDQQIYYAPFLESSQVLL